MNGSDEVDAVEEVDLLDSEVLMVDDSLDESVDVVKDGEIADRLEDRSAVGVSVEECVEEKDFAVSVAKPAELILVDTERAASESATRVNRTHIFGL